MYPAGEFQAESVAQPEARIGIEGRCHPLESFFELPARSANEAI